MRRTTTTIIALAGLLVSGAASAAETTKETGKTGASAPTGAPTSDPGGGKVLDDPNQRDRPTDTTFANKTWGVSASAEYHHGALNGEYIDDKARQNVMYYGVNARWDPTPYDRVSVRYGFTEFLVADAGESGVRSDDISFSYTRRIPLPGQTNLRLTGSFTAPVSYASQLAGVYTVPKLSISADKRFGRYFSMDARVTGSVYIVKFASGGSAYNDGGISGFGYGPATVGNGLGTNAPGANPNPKGGVSLALGADLAMPFHTPLSIGIGLYVSYAWLYNVCGNLPPGWSESATGMMSSSGACTAPAENASQGQPFFQSWGDEIYVRYALPTVGGLSSDLSAAYAPNGDPSTGFASVTHGTGIGQVYPFFYRQNAEVYFTFSARY